jgi:MinD superfamily P-loop ATPase
MKEIVVLSGKGGTGKTSITACFARLAGREAVLADCDVDAADMHLLMKPEQLQTTDFYSGELAFVDERRCTGCGRCKENCHFDAIRPVGNIVRVEPLKCEGCGLCSRICPENAIHNEKVLSGRSYISKTRLDSIMVHARLAIGAANSGKLVAEVKEKAWIQAEMYGAKYILIDGSPGIGCPVISSLSGASLAVVVAEASLSGFSDMKRLAKLIEGFHIPAACIINKTNINPEISKAIKSFLEKKNIPLLGEIPYNECFTRAVLEGKTVVEMIDGRINKIIGESWNKILQTLKLEVVA